MSSENCTEHSDATALLDLLLPVVENLRLLIFVPLLAGAASYGLSHLISPTYESSAVQSGDALLAAMYNSAQVRGKMVEQLEYKFENETNGQALERLTENLVISFNSRNSTLSVSARGKSPEQAQQLARAAIANTAQLNQQRIEDVSRLRKQFDLATQREREYAVAAEKIANKIIQSDEDLGVLVQAQAQLLRAAQDAQEMTSSLAGQLRQAQDFELLQRPTLPDEPVAPKPVVIGLLAMLGANLLLLVYVFGRHAVRMAGQNPDAAKKLAAIRAAWGKAWGV